jgi:peptidoglycan/xylan/chitin deacetylase (PgdA/CDA1 family)
MAVGLVTLGETMYAFTADGAMLHGMQTFDGAHYYFGDDGALVTGWVTAEDGQHYFDAPGSEYIGWHYYNDGWHYFSPSGVLDESKRYSDAPAVALTFDDGPGEYTHAILDLLERYHVKATFFMIGMEVEKYADAVKREHDIGMEQGNHTWDHKTLTHLTPPDIAKEITSTNDVIRSITGQNPTVFRPPGGGTNATVQATSQGMPLILWNIDTVDWDTRDAQNTYNIVMNEVGDGDIILMHEIYDSSYDAACMIIPDLLRRGYQLVTVSELAKLKGVNLKAGGVYSYF